MATINFQVCGVIHQGKRYVIAGGDWRRKRDEERRAVRLAQARLALEKMARVKREKADPQKTGQPGRPDARTAQGPQIPHLPRQPAGPAGMGGQASDDSEINPTGRVVSTAHQLPGRNLRERAGAGALQELAGRGGGLLPVEELLGSAADRNYSGLLQV